MNKIVIKPYWNYEKEESWLNEMAKEGWALVNYTWMRYEFEKSEPGEYIYRIELLEKHTKNTESKEYIDFLESTGIEHVTSYMRWLYIRRKADEGEFNLFSDIDSKLKHYKSVNSFWLTLALANITIGFSNLTIGMVNIGFSSVNRINLFGGILCLTVGTLLMIMSSHVRKRIKQLNEQKTVAE